MTLTELDAIRARDAAPLSQQVVLDALYDRRLLLAYVDELRAKLATEVKNKKQFERDWLEACDQVSTLRAELAALREAAGKVGCIACDNAGEII